MAEGIYTMTESEFHRELAEAWDMGHALGRVDLPGQAKNPYRGEVRSTESYARAKAEVRLMQLRLNGLRRKQRYYSRLIKWLRKGAA